MAGHSKWAQIKHKKAAIDAKRGRLWTRLVREVMVAARLGGGDPEGNARLRSAIQDAKDANVPNDTIDRAVKKGTGELEGASYEEISYEGYAPGGVAVLVETMTDNRNRTVAELRHLFSKNGGNLGDSGCVAWMFERRGLFVVDRSAMDEEALMELALAVGVEDFAVEDEGYELHSSVDDYARVRAILEEAGYRGYLNIEYEEKDEDAATAVPRFASHLARLRKPDEALFAHVERVAGVPAESIVFFDDLRDNVVAAERRGWRGHWIDPALDEPIGQIRHHLRAHELLK